MADHRADVVDLAVSLEDQIGFRQIFQVDLLVWSCIIIA